MIELEELARRLDDAALTILDVRSPREFSGERGYPCDPRQGHIPGAKHLWVNELMGLGADELRARLGEVGEVVAYCHSGVRSAHAVEMLRAAGFEARNYSGSWHEWSRHDELPVER